MLQCKSRVVCYMPCSSGSLPGSAPRLSWCTRERYCLLRGDFGPTNSSRLLGSAVVLIPSRIVFTSGTTISVCLLTSSLSSSLTVFSLRRLSSPCIRRYRLNTVSVCLWNDSVVTRRPAAFASLTNGFTDFLCSSSSSWYVVSTVKPVMAAVNPGITELRKDLQRLVLPTHAYHPPFRI